MSESWVFPDIPNPHEVARASLPSYAKELWPAHLEQQWHESVISLLRGETSVKRLPSAVDVMAHNPDIARLWHG